MALIAGVDEAGRGPLAGPVVSAAVILPPDHSIIGLRDSKQLTPKRRAELLKLIRAKAISIGIGIVNEKIIDRINILKATQKAMQMALGRLKPGPDKALIDGYGLPNQIIPNEGVIKGDTKVDSIQAASIVAKVTRDRLMLQYDLIFPEYGFAQHKGYGTEQHISALREFKATPIHRKSFKPVLDNLGTISWYRKQGRVGWLGERLAALYLREKGYLIKSLNEYCSPYGEIDLIAEKQGEIIFIEVKTVSREQLGSPELKVDIAKMKKLEKAINLYLMEREISNDIRLDVITVSIGKGKPQIKHFKGIELY